MDLVFSNPAGFWALAGIPAILAIHFFQRESRTVLISTLFLLKEIAPESVEGRRIDRLRNSLLLWLQLLAVVILTWLLVQPRWLREDSVQSVVVVLDSSSSMEAFRDQVSDSLRGELGRLARTASRTEWTLLESDERRGALYTGDSLAALIDSLKAWEPRLGVHDISASLRTGQELVRKKGILIFVTDHVPEVPEGVEVLAVGKPVDNCGFAGVSVERMDGQLIWRALLRNYGSSPQSRKWWPEYDGKRGEAREILLQPGEIDAVQGPFPAGVKSLDLVLDSDKLTLDDRLPLLEPEKKRLFYRAAGGKAFAEFFRRLVTVFEDVEPAGQAMASDIDLVSYDPTLGRFPTGKGLVFLEETTGARRIFSGMVIAENHPLVDGLNWRGLVCSGSLEILGKPDDDVLLWQGPRPLIFLRKVPGHPGERQLVFNFDPRLSNAERLPAFVLLIHRFLEAERAQKVAFEAVNADTQQRLNVTADPLGAPVSVRGGDGKTIAELPAAQASVIRAPSNPGFFEVRQGDKLLVRGAAHFGDAREADLSQAESFNSVENKMNTFARRNSREDFLTPLWTLLFAGTLLGTWFIQARRA